MTRHEQFIASLKGAAAEISARSLSQVRDRDDWERTRPFAGVTITPDVGMSAGVNVLLTRGIGVTAGAVLLFAKGAAAEDIGKAPAHADKPYALSFAGGVVIGVSYNFK